jgi:hypothetical protein
LEKHWHEKGYEIMKAAACKKGRSIIARQTTTLMARLPNDREKPQSLCIYGLARFAYHLIRYYTNAVIGSK